MCFSNDRLSICNKESLILPLSLDIQIYPVLKEQLPSNQDQHCFPLCFEIHSHNWNPTSLIG